MWTLVSAIQKKKGTRYGIEVDEVYPVFWVPFVGGISSGVSAVGTAESMFPLLERYLKVQPHRAIATAILIEASMNWLATALNLSFENFVSIDAEKYLSIEGCSTRFAFFDSPAI